MRVSALLPLLGFFSGLILANSSFSPQLRAVFSAFLSRLFIPIVIIYNMVFYQAGSLSLMLFSFFSAILLFFIYFLLSKDRLQALCFSYTNMAWLGFPIAIALFGEEISSAMIAIYVGGSIFGNVWAVASVSTTPLALGDMFKKVLKSPPVVALLLAALFRVLQLQTLEDHQWIEAIYQFSKWGMVFTGMSVLGMWLRKTKVHWVDLIYSFKIALLKVFCGLVFCSFAYYFLAIANIHEYIGVMFLLFCLPPAANIVALETHYQGTGVSAKYIASGTIVSCVICVLYGAVVHLS